MFLQSIPLKEIQKCVGFGLWKTRCKLPKKDGTAGENYRLNVNKKAINCAFSSFDKLTFALSFFVVA